MLKQTPPSGIYPEPGQVEKHADANDIVPALGKKGTVVFADTAGLHWGGYVMSGTRRMLTVGFLPPKSFLVRQVHYKRAESEKMSPLKEYATEVDEGLFSRSAYVYLKGLLMGKDSVGGHITGKKGWM